MAEGMAALQQLLSLAVSSRVHDDCHEAVAAALTAQMKGVEGAADVQPGWAQLSTAT